MNRKGIFGPFIVFILLVLLVWVWAIMLPSVTPVIGDTIASTQAGGTAHSDGVEFFLRMIPWAVPLILVIGFLWLMVGGR